MLTLCVGFTAYLLSEECDIFDPVHTDVCHDMTHPLSHYFIAASHKTCALRAVNLWLNTATDIKLMFHLSNVDVDSNSQQK